MKFYFPTSALEKNFLVLFENSLFYLIPATHMRTSQLTEIPFFNLCWLYKLCSPPSHWHYFTKNNIWLFSGLFGKLEIFPNLLFYPLSSHLLCPSCILLPYSSFFSIKNQRQKCSKILDWKVVWALVVSVYMIMYVNERTHTHTLGMLHICAIFLPLESINKLIY